MDIIEKIQFWKNEIERAEQNDFYFDTDSMNEVVQTVEELLEENKRLKSKVDIFCDQ